MISNFQVTLLSIQLKGFHPINFFTICSTWFFCSSFFPVSHDLYLTLPHNNNLFILISGTDYFPDLFISKPCIFRFACYMPLKSYFHNFYLSSMSLIDSFNCWVRYFKSFSLWNLLAACYSINSSLPSLDFTLSLLLFSSTNSMVVYFRSTYIILDDHYQQDVILWFLV